jgi:hypothetical protein
MSLTLPACGVLACSSIIGPSNVVNGMVVTTTISGSVFSVNTQTGGYPICNDGFYVLTRYYVMGYQLGYLNCSSITLNFSLPINNINCIIGGAGNSFNTVNPSVDWGCETWFTFTTNSGNPSIIKYRGCYDNIINNQIYFSPPALPSDTPGEGNGIFMIYNNTPFTSLKVESPCKCQGSNIAFCAESLCLTSLPSPTPTSTPKQTPTTTVTPTVSRSFGATPIPTQTPTLTPNFVPCLNCYNNYPCPTPPVTPTNTLTSTPTRTRICCSTFQISKRINSGGDAKYIVDSCIGQSGIFTYTYNQTLTILCAQSITEINNTDITRLPGCNTCY